MKRCSECNCKINLSTRIKTLGNECTYIKCENCGTVYEVESKEVVKIINLLSFFMIFYLIYYFLDFMGVEKIVRICTVFLLSVIFYIAWNILMSYVIGYKPIIEGYNGISNSKESDVSKYHNTNEAEKMLKDILTKHGFNDKNINLDILIDSFEEFSQQKFNCYRDSIMYNLQPVEYICEDLCCCTLLRQFETRNASGQLGMERLYVQIYYKTNDMISRLYSMYCNYDSYRFDDFFEVVRNEDSYWAILKEYEPVKYELYAERA